MIKMSLFLLIFSFYSTSIAGDKIHLTPNNEIFVNQPNIDDIYQVFDSLLAYSNTLYMAKKIKVINDKQPEFSDETWPEGTWGRGYYTKDVEYYPNEYSDSKYMRWINNNRSCNPLYREVSRRILGYIHEYSNRAHTDLNQIKAAITYLVNQQLEDGGFQVWYQRVAKYEITGVEKKEGNLYETSIALQALCEGYIFLNSSLVNDNSHNTNLMNTIIRCADFLLNYPNLDVQYPNGKYLAVWALIGAYKITREQKYLEKCISATINTRNMQREDGSWKTPDTSEPYHDAIIFYHGITLRGLAELYSVIKEERLRKVLKNKIVTGINHLIDYNGVGDTRFDTSWPGAFKLEHKVQNSTGVERGMTLLGSLILIKSYIDFSQNDRLQLDYLINYTVAGFVYISNYSTYYTYADCDISLHNLGMYLDYAGYSSL